MDTPIFSAPKRFVFLLLLQLPIDGCTPSPNSNPPPNEHHEASDSEAAATSMRAPSPEKSPEKSGAPSPQKRQDVQRENGVTPPSVPPPDQQFEITRQVTSYENYVDISPKGKDRPAIDWRSKSARIFIEWNKDQPLSQQTAVLREMLMQLAIAEKITDLTNASMSTSLDWYSNPEYAKRIAQAAATDTEWTDARRTRNQHWDPAWSLHKYIVRVAESKRLFTELDEIFAPLGVRPVLEGVEKCSTARANGKGELGKLLKDGGIRSSKVLPAGCLMSWFKLEKLSGF